MSDSEPSDVQPTLDFLNSDLLLCIANALPEAADLVSFSCIAHQFADALASTRQSTLALACKALHDAYSFHHCRDGPCRWDQTSCDWLERSRLVQLRALPKHQLLAAQALVLVHVLARRRWPALEELVFDCIVSDEALVILARALPAVAPALTRLSLSGCSVRDAGAVAIAEAVSGLPCLRELCMEDNPFSPTARGKLRLACRPRKVTLTAFSEIENESLY